MQYQLSDLTKICARHLGEQLTIETVVTILCLADLHRANELKSKCIDFISNNSKKVTESKGWEQIKATPDLLMELYLHLSHAN